MITNWSFSKLDKYETCPMRVKLQYIDRIPEPPPDAKSPLVRGNNEHDLFERYVRGDASALERSTAKRLDVFRPGFEALARLFADGMATTEEDWTYDDDWVPVPKDQNVVWIKLDFCVTDEEAKRVIVGDYKTGRSDYKTITHVQQTQLYAGAAALRYPWAEEIVTELWYVDAGELRPYTYDVDQALRYLDRFRQRAHKMMSDNVFRPNPSVMTCKYCPYSPRGTGHCPVGV